MELSNGEKILFSFLGYYVFVVFSNLYVLTNDIIQITEVIFIDLLLIFMVAGVLLHYL